MNTNKETLKARIDMVLLLSVRNANPNGDPSYEGRPRTTRDGYGFITDVCLKHKIRKALTNAGEAVLYQAEEDATDGFVTIKDRLRGCEEMADILKEKKDPDVKRAVEVACNTWTDVRAFGCMVPFEGKKSIGTKCAVSIQDGVSVSKIDVTEIGITKCVNMDKKKDKNGDAVDGKGSDTMGSKYRVPFGLYVVKASISPYQADKNGFTAEDAEKIKQAILHMFDDDASAARPAGSMNVEKLFWWDHSKSGEGRLPKASLKQVHDSVVIKSLINPDDYPTSMADYEISCVNCKGIAKPEVYDANSL